jgi:hypothetical protein
MLSEKNYYALLEYRREKYTGPKITEQIRYFKECGYIRPVSHELKETAGEFCMNPTVWIITPRGEDSLAEFEYRAEQDTKSNAEKKQERIFQVLLVFLGAIIGLLIEHFAGIADWISSFF